MSTQQAPTLLRKRLTDIKRGARSSSPGSRVAPDTAATSPRAHGASSLYRGLGSSGTQHAEVLKLDGIALRYRFHSANALRPTSSSPSPRHGRAANESASPKVRPSGSAVLFKGLGGMPAEPASPRAASPLRKPRAPTDVVGCNRAPATLHQLLGPYSVTIEGRDQATKQFGRPTMFFVRVDGAQFHHVVHRKYKDFSEVRDAISALGFDASRGSVDLPKMPLELGFRRLFAATEPSFMNDRQAALAELAVAFVAADPHADTPELRRFLGLARAPGALNTRCGAESHLMAIDEENGAALLENGDSNDSDDE